MIGWAVLGVAVVVVAYLVVSARLYLVLARVPARSASGSQAAGGGGDADPTPAAFDVPPVDTEPYRVAHFEAIGFPSADGRLGLSGWWIPALGDVHARAPVVILAHALGSSRRSGRVLLTAGMLHRSGFGVLALDLRNHGQSHRDNGRHAAGTKEYADILGAWRWLTGLKGINPDRIGLAGGSLGAAAVILAAAREPRIPAVWADSSYADLAGAARSELRRAGLPGFMLAGGRLAARLFDGFDLAGPGPLEALANLNGRRVFVIQGSQDSRIPPASAERLVEAGGRAGVRMESWIVAGSEHLGAVVDRPDEYERRMVGFFRAGLASEVS